MPRVKYNIRSRGRRFTTVFNGPRKLPTVPLITLVDSDRQPSRDTIKRDCVASYLRFEFNLFEMKGI